MLQCKPSGHSKAAIELTYLQDMLSSVEGDNWDLLARRCVRHFGYKFEYEVSFQMDGGLLVHASHLSSFGDMGTA